MERRAFLAASTAAALTQAEPLAAASGPPAQSAAGAPPALLELRRYRLRNGPMTARFSAYAKDALVPALGRAGIAPVGAWTVSFGPQSPTLHLLIPHASAESLATPRVPARRATPSTRSAAAVLPRAAARRILPSSAATRRSWRAVPTLPGIRKPEGPAAAPSRVFELRTYHSPSEAAGRKKIEMFEAGGELGIFARLGMHTVFFGRDMLGAGLPSLTYMLAFADVAAREKAWTAFREDPEWVKLRDQPAYADVVSGDRRVAAASHRLLAALSEQGGPAPARPWTLAVVGALRPARRGRPRGRSRSAACCACSRSTSTSPTSSSSSRARPASTARSWRASPGSRTCALEPVPVSAWDDLVPALVADRGDVIAGRFTVTEERKRRIAFTRETFPTRNVVLTRQPTPPVRSLEALRALRVGTVKGSSMAEAVAQAGVPPANVDDGIRPGGLPQALASGRVKAVVLGVESAITAQRDDPQVELGMFVGPPGSLAFGVRRGDDQLLAALDRYIQNLRRTATWNRLAVKYFGDSAPEVLRKARE